MELKSSLLFGRCSRAARSGEEALSFFCDTASRGARLERRFRSDGAIVAIEVCLLACLLVARYTEGCVI